MTWPFENDTGAIVKKLAKRSLASEKRRNLMVVVAVSLAAFLICFTALLSVSITQIQRGKVADTYEAVFTGSGTPSEETDQAQSIHARFGASTNVSAGMCDMLLDANFALVESALVSGAMPTNSHSVLLDVSNHKYFEDMDVGAAIELSLGRRSATVTISGFFDSHKITNGHGALAMDGTVLFAPKELFQGFYPEIKNFDYSWSVVSDPAKAEYVESGLRELLSGYSDLGLDTIGAHIEYEKMQKLYHFRWDAGSLICVLWA